MDTPTFDWPDYLWKLLPLGLVFLGVLTTVPVLVFLERKVSAFIQDRIGPNRVGLMGPDGALEGIFGLGLPLTQRRVLGGWFQPLADVIKLLAKEDIVPAHADRFLYTLAPLFALLPPLLAFIVVPIGADLEWGPRRILLQVADLHVGILWVLSVASLSAYGIALGGWAAHNKYSLLGGIRATAQMISYEIGLGLVILSLAMQYETVSLREMVRQQAAGFGEWGVFHQPLAFILFLVCAFAENNRLPFDLPECETELVGGYHTEYSSLKFGMFFQAEYIAMLAMGALVAVLFLGGWHYPGYAAVQAAAGANLAALISVAAFGLKVLLFVLFQIWVRWTLPRFRYDQLMKLGWYFFFELALVNIFITAFVLAYVKG